jgi:methionyl-tRNA synthetase
VWVDALTNYLTGVGFPDVDSASFRKYWPADVHVIGKDISRFHAIYWPAFLMSAKLPLPKRVMIHGFLHNNGVKMSKSLGNTVSPDDFVNRYGLDQVRYFFLREVPFGADGSYNHETIVARINGDLANNFGNLAQRSLSMVAKNCGGVVPTPGKLLEADQQILDAAGKLLETNRDAFSRQEFSKALEAVWHVLGDTNAYFAEQEPWKLKKTDPERMATVLYVTIEIVRKVALLLQPVLPQAMTSMLNALAVGEGSARTFESFESALVPGTELPAPSPVFPRYEEE